MQTTPFFSLIIPTYNRSKFIAKALGGVLNQTFQDFEVIIVDDGSTDNTAEVVTKLKNSDDRIHYYYKQNEERSIARNFGIDKARGKYVNFLDSDDIQYPNHFAIAYALIQQNKLPEVAHLGFEMIEPDGKIVFQRKDFDDTFKTKLIHENILHGNAIFIRTDVARQVQFVPSRRAVISEDWYLWLRLAARYKFHFDNTITTAVVQHDERSLLNINPDKLIASTQEIVENLKNDSIFMKAYKGMTNYHFANHYTFVTLILALTKKRRGQTLKYLITAMRYDPTVIFRRRFLASVKHLL